MARNRSCPPRILTAIALVAGLACADAAKARGPQAEPRRPNVILVMTDDQGYGDLSCHGNPVLRTPNLDRLHAGSVRLTDFHVDPTCSPTRSALMTGRYSGRVGVWHTIMGRSILPAREVTMAEAFRSAGYRTAVFGKWHLGDNYPSRPQDQGFDEVFVHGGGGVGQTPDHWGNDYFDDTYFRDGRPEPAEGYCTDVWFDNALAFVEENRGRPFFLYLPTNAPHGPYLVPDRYKAPYEGHPDVPNPAFYGMIANIDENMGRLLDRLEELGLARGTILLFMTDNGTAAGFDGKRGFNAGMRGRKGSQYDGGHRVPCFIRWPGGGIEGGRDVDRLAAHLDLLPTLLELCGLPAPEGVEFDGRSLAPLLKGSGAGWPDRAVVVESQRIEHPIKWRQCAVMTDRWRLIDGRELYDMARDPGQLRDVAEDHPEVVRRLTSRYNAWWRDVSSGHDDYARIVLGAGEEDPTRLTCHDWHESSPPWNQGMIRRGETANGFWAVEIPEAGTYEFELRRWPREDPRPIDEGPGIAAATARIEVLGVGRSAAVEPGAEAVRFRVPLEAGPGRLRTWLIDDEGKARGAYFVYVRRLDD